MEGCTACVPGGRCVCNDVANEQARRVAIQQRVSQVADKALWSLDPSQQPVTDAGRLSATKHCFFALEEDVRSGLDPEEGLLTLAAAAQVWLEAREREAAR